MMSLRVKQILLWAPRALGLLFGAFIALFALDVFGHGYGIWRSLAAFLIHLIPTGLILIAVFVAWRWEWLGGVLFLALIFTFPLLVVEASSHTQLTSDS